MTTPSVQEPLMILQNQLSVWTEALGRIGKGDLSVRLTNPSADKSLPPPARKSFEHFVQGFNTAMDAVASRIAQSLDDTTTFVASIETMADNLANLSAHTRKIHEESASAAGGTQTATGRLAGAIDVVDTVQQSLSELARSMKSISGDLDSDCRTVEMVSDTITAISESAGNMSISIGSVASAIEEMSASLSEVARNSASAAGAAREASDATVTTNEKMDALGKSAKSIGKIVEIIKGIASQTNLLALNATIEAASAGDAGKGFAVVAGEVKELAKQTAAATENIRDQVEIMQERAHEAVQAIQDISIRIGQISDISHLIAAAVEEQTATTNEIARSISQTTAGAEEIDTAVHGAATTARQVTVGIKGAAEQVSNVAKDLTETSGKMQHTMQEIHSSVDGLGKVSSNVGIVSDSLASAKGEIAQFESTVSMLLELAGMLKESWNEAKLK